jgi:hypothetical protein
MSVDNYFTWQYIPEDNSELYIQDILLMQVIIYNFKKDLADFIFLQNNSHTLI